MGEKLENLLNGEKRGYAPLNPLVSLYTDKENVPNTFDEAVEKLREAAEELINRIEETATMPIEKFTIGKSYSRQMKNRPFDPTNFKTWIKKGLKDRWDSEYKSAGYDGLVALVGITRELLPLDMKKGRRRHSLQDQQQYALALEQQLIHYFLFMANDRRLGNKSLEPGAYALNPFAGVVYLAFKLYTICEVWQQFEDSFELEQEPYDTIFVITTDNIQASESERKKKIIGGRKAEDHVLTYLESDELEGMKLKLFINNVPSEQFAMDLVKVRPENGSSVIIARDIDASNETVEILSNNGCIVREFTAEDDWNDLGTALYHPEDSLTLQKGIENDKLRMHLKKPSDEVLEIFEDSMLEEKDKQWIASESCDQAFVINYISGMEIITGRIVEKRVIHFLKNRKGDLGQTIKLYINYPPKEIYVKHLAKTIKEDGEIALASLCIGSDEDIDDMLIDTDALTVEMRTITIQDWHELENLLSWE